MPVGVSVEVDSVQIQGTPPKCEDDMGSTILSFARDILLFRLYLRRVVWHPHRPVQPQNVFGKLAKFPVENDADVPAIDIDDCNWPVRTFYSCGSTIHV